ncbi:MAG: OsmC family protein [Thermoplasmata archaeon]
MPADDGRVELEQLERYRFVLRYVDAPFPGLTVDEPPPVGGDAGPNPVQALAAAVGHCMSSTFVNSLERAHVAVAPIRTTVSATVGVNDRGRRRVRALHVDIYTRPLSEADRARFEHCVEIFADYCTVSGAVREGVQIDSRVAPP